MATNIGTGPQDVPLNQFLGQMAFIDDVPLKPSFQAVKNSSAYNFTASTATVVAGWNPNHNDGGMLDPTTGIVTIPFPGLYWFYFSAMSQRDDSGDYQISIRKNGTLYVNSNDLCDSGTTTYQQTTITTIIKCEKGDEIGFYGYNSSGTTSVIYQGSYTHIGGYQIH